MVDRQITRLLALGVPVCWLTHRGRSGFWVRTPDLAARSLTKFHQVIFTFGLPIDLPKWQHEVAIVPDNLLSGKRRQTDL